ncbi:RecQ-mediated genome instability protein 1 [Sporothrix brasiliensis 5110]|uniref:RecQ-mediated genome instability protein 1 n=1 Tax=Sporothrix brasiliensis 5110 TaxID=1398154 RepID=A0A0C2IIQ9_9PEZI|nr:RecQ-mediated genome instability protein 1 [Sporothrix brasiliensis 5110]KIH89061.1 RecQ-mediated genome instability protein 1 [Sporothrix brasiliensis 5110]
MNQALKIRSALAAEQLPEPSQAWLQSIITQQPAQQRSLSTLVAATKTRLLATDLTASGLFDNESRPAVFPRDLLAASAASVQETRLANDIVVQVVDLENLSQSRWQQVQALEAIERGEQKRGREIIRLPTDGGDGEGDDDTGAESSRSGPGRPATAASSGPSDASSTHRLVLQDAAGNTLYALELTRIYRISVSRLRMGEKLLIKAGTAVARGTLLLEPTSVKFLGGQVESMHKTWLEGRLARLREAAHAE